MLWIECMLNTLPINHKGWHDENPLENYTLFFELQSIFKNFQSVIKFLKM